MKYYAVRKGRNPGIYTSWDKCLLEVKNFKGAIYKSFKSLDEAKDFLEDKEKEEIKLDENTAIAFVDGSYNKAKEIYGAGVYYLTKSNEKEIFETYKDGFYKHRNVAGEVKASELAIDTALADGKSKLYIYHDYQGIAAWANGDWKANNELTQSYKKFIQEKRKEIAIFFIKVKAHSNDPNNDKADELAKKGAQIEA